MSATETAQAVATKEEHQ